MTEAKQPYHLSKRRDTPAEIVAARADHDIIAGVADRLHIERIVLLASDRPMDEIRALCRLIQAAEEEAQRLARSLS